MAVDQPLEPLFEVVRVLDQLGVRYLMGGSLASSVHGVPRSTHDADLVADLRLEHVQPLTAALGSRFYLDADRIREAIRLRSSFNVIFLETMFKIDIFLLKQDPFSQEEMRRRRPVALEDVPDRLLQVASAEDTVLQKLKWHRQGGGVSERQWQDLLGVIKVQRQNLDLAYLQRWARHLGVDSLLSQAFREAGIED